MLKDLVAVSFHSSFDSCAQVFRDYNEFMVDQSEDTPVDDDTDLARRKLLKTAGWVPPAIVAAVSIGTRHAIAVTCGPGPGCSPSTCNPATCNPADMPPCMPG
ncbi:MAG: hypothetical protein HN816_07875 [Gammaproteobacteria bacterium]|nr:hypothetical protein [Gammaproteobacteria bacterium]